MDPAGAQEAGYRGRLVPGALTFALAEGLLMQTNVIHGTGIAFLGTTMTVTAPVFVGDTIAGGLDRDGGAADVQRQPGNRHHP